MCGYFFVQGSNLDSSAKQWRLAADFMNDIGNYMIVLYRDWIALPISSAMSMSIYVPNCASLFNQDIFFIANQSTAVVLIN